jgi:D-glycerate 3-kinase
MPAALPLTDAIAHRLGPVLRDGSRFLFVLGLCGAQGSGKTTLANALARHFEAEGIRTALLSIDDLYCTRSERERLGETIHPLLRTRGVPGTHDVGLGLAVIEALDQDQATPLPRFDKARDDRCPPSQWGQAEAGTRLLILEGWCVGARPEPETALAEPVNTLERDEDRDGRWRRFVNTALAGDYQRLFARIDGLVLLAAPDFAVVRDWRIEQEHELRAHAPAGSAGLMDDAAITRFIQHYERLTRHILTEMPARADLVVSLAADRSPIAIRAHGPTLA